MRTKDQELNIVFDKSIVDVLSIMAKQKNKSLANVATELILDALEREEDMALSALAKSRDTKKVKKIKHEDVWK